MLGRNALHEIVQAMSAAAYITLMQRVDTLDFENGPGATRVALLLFRSPDLLAPFRQQK